MIYKVLEKENKKILLYFFILENNNIYIDIYSFNNISLKHT